MEKDLGLLCLEFDGLPTVGVSLNFFLAILCCNFLSLLTSNSLPLQSMSMKKQPEFNPLCRLHYSNIYLINVQSGLS